MSATASQPARRPYLHGYPPAVNAILSGVPAAGAAVAAAMLAQGNVRWSDVAILATMYTATSLGVNVGIHRLLTHRAFETSARVRNTLAVLGSMAAELPPVVWVAYHREHHAFADDDGDPHSPHTHGSPGRLGTLRGLWHAAVGWALERGHPAHPERYAPDLLRDPAIVRISAGFIPIVLLGQLIPFLLGLALTQSLAGGLSGLLWGGLVRVFLQHQAGFAVNSLGHFAGRRRFRLRDRSTNVAWLAIPAFGESWHNNHHAFPRSARHGLSAREVDLSWAFIRLLEALGLAWDVVRVDPDAIRAKEARAAS